MYFYTILSIFLLALQGSVAPPTKTTEKPATDENTIEEKELNLEYDRYLREVVNVLEKDEEFRKILESSNDSDIQSGKIADKLYLVHPDLRTKLDEAKRTEVDRLRKLYLKIFEQENGIERDHVKILKNLEHLDHEDPHQFKEEDLRKLITKVTKDLAEADAKRKEEFKEYEMHKKFEQEQKKKNMTEEEKKKYEKQLQENEIKHKNHEPLHHPGSKKQLEEVWEKQDHMENQEFDPKAFFHMHDLDGNGVWDEMELKAIFVQEIRKLYEEGHPEDDIVEKAEELERMREHVLLEADTNKDRLISYEEFVKQSQKAEFQKDPGWESIDQQQIYSNQEYEAYERRLAEEMARYPGHAGGYNQYPPHPNQVPQPNYGQHPGHPQQQQPIQHPQQGQYVGQGYQHQVPQPQYGHHVPQQQYHPNDVNYVPQQQQQYHPNDVNYVPQQQQYHPNDINYVPQQPNHHPNQQAPGIQVPQQQYYQPQAANQVPQQPPAAVPNANHAPGQQFQQHPNNVNVPQQPPQNQAPVANANVNSQQQYQQVPQQQAQQQTQQFQQQPQQQNQQQPQQQNQQQPQQQNQQQSQQNQQQPQQQNQQQPVPVGTNQQQFQQPPAVPNTNANQQQQKPPNSVNH